MSENLYKTIFYVCVPMYNTILLNNYDKLLSNGSTLFNSFNETSENEISNSLHKKIIDVANYEISESIVNVFSKFYGIFCLSSYVV